MHVTKPAVSVCIFTFNFEKYLAQSIESVLEQHTVFPFEIIIGDDYSTDSTREIANSYQQKYPEIIKLSFNHENKGGTFNWINTINLCLGNYIALLDGDDYFIDRYKLQKQFDSLEKDPHAVLCFHAVEEKYDDMEGKDKVVRFEKPLYTLEDFLSRGWFIRTGSTFFKNFILPAQPPPWVYNFPYRYDTIMHVFLGMHGHAIYIDDVMSVWRKHQQGMSYFLLEKTILNISKEVELARQLDEYTHKIYNNHVNNYCAIQHSRLFLNLIRSGLFIKHPLQFLFSLIKMNYLYFFKQSFKFLDDRVPRMGQ